jgi:hypothetical protein
MNISLLLASIVFVVILNFVQIKMLKELYQLEVHKVFYISISIVATTIAWISGNDLIAAISVGIHFIALFGIAIFSVIKSNALLSIHMSSIRDRIIQSQNSTLIEPNSFSVNVNPIFQIYVIILCLYDFFFMKDEVSTITDDSDSISFQVFTMLFCLYLSLLYLILKSKMMEALVLESKNKNNYKALKIKTAIICISTLVFYLMAKNLIDPMFIGNLFDYENISLSLNNLAVNYSVYLLLQLFYFVTNPFAFSVQTICKAIVLYQNIFASIFVTLIVCVPLFGISKLFDLDTNTASLFLLGFNVTLLMTEYFMYKNKKILESKNEAESG